MSASSVTIEDGSEIYTGSAGVPRATRLASILGCLIPCLTTSDAVLSYAYQGQFKGGAEAKGDAKKVAILGAAGAGKSSLFVRFLGQGFPLAESLQGQLNDDNKGSSLAGPPSPSAHRSKLNIGCRMLRALQGDVERALFLELWDVPADGQARTDLASEKALEDVDLIALVFDLRSKESFLSATNALDELKVRAHEDGAPPRPALLLGNFSDILGDPGLCKFGKDVEGFVSRNKGLSFQSVSARTGEGVMEALKTMCSLGFENDAQ